MEDDDMDLLEARFALWLKKIMGYSVPRLASKHRKYRKKQLLILDSPIYDDNEEGMIDRMAADEDIDITEEICSNIEVQKKLSKLPKKQRTTVIYTILSGCSEAKTAKKMGIS
jgi:DNA-directed RNA polymerase specialized sigma24 family protein